MSPEIIPSLLVDGKETFEQRLRLVENHVKTVAVDILDGSTYQVTNWFNAEAISAMQTPVQFVLHLMVENPLPIIARWMSLVPNTVRAIIHAESDRPLAAIVQQIRQTYKIEAGLALNPETPLNEIHHVLHEVDEILVMGVRPGHSGQIFGGEMILEKTRQLHGHVPEIPLAVDGGVQKENIRDLLSAGISRFHVTSAIFETEDPIKSLKELQTMVGML